MKSGVKRLLQLGAVLVACLAAHYAWAIAWPVVSCIIAVVMAIVWAVRLVVKLVGRVAIACQRACGGAPEAYGAEFYGPGTGKVPETAELRRFKKHDAEQWLALKRGSKMVVFQSNGEPSSIKATGLFVAVDYDTVRGDAELTRELKGVDRVHLCRNVTCPEEGPFSDLWDYEEGGRREDSVGACWSSGGVSGCFQMVVEHRVYSCVEGEGLRVGI